MFSLLTLLLYALATHAIPQIVRRADVNGDTVSGKWIVQLAPNAVLDNGLVQELKTSYGIKVDQNSSFDLGQLKGFTVKANDTAIDSLASHVDLLTIQPATLFSISATSRRPPVTQTNATWGLDRLSHQRWTYSSRDFPTNLTEYIYSPSAGIATFVYVIDTGIYIAHNEFGGRASNGANFVTGEYFTDLVGHGTHIAGIAGGKTYGVAKKTNLISVKAVNAAGTSDTSIILKALDWIFKDATTNKRLSRSVVNLSIGGAYDKILNDAINALTNAGIFVVVAAGNGAVDANTTSPASAAGACAIGSMTYINSVNTFSNYGPKVAVHAPGFRVFSAGTNGPDSTVEMTGTSQAAPFVAGLGAYLIGTDSKYIGQKLCSQVQQLATKGQLTDNSGKALANGTPNLIAFNGAFKARNY